MRDMKPSYLEEIEEYSLVFYTEPGCGLSFPCDKDGKVDVNSLEAPALKNYEYALHNPKHYPIAWNKVERIKRSYKHPATGICKCGKRIELTNQYLGACDCPYCGQWWNLFGQELNPVDEWGKLDYDY